MIFVRSPDYSSSGMGISPSTHQPDCIPSNSGEELRHELTRISLMRHDDICLYHLYVSVPVKVRGSFQFAVRYIPKSMP